MRHVDHLANSGWTAFASVRSVLSDSGAPLPDEDFLRGAFAPSVWEEVDHACELLESRFRDCRYSDSVSYGPLLVPNPALLDVRRALDDRIRDSHPDIVRPDFVDARLPCGADATDPASPWTLFAAAVSDAGPAMGSYDEIMGHDGDSFTVADVDTRELMTRQLWCSLVIQNLRAPDCATDGRSRSSPVRSRSRERSSRGPFCTARSDSVSASRAGAAPPCACAPPCG